MLKKLTKDTRKISKWSGGVTEELYIYPEKAEYKDRNFKFRISVATTEDETSVFTKLPGVNRVISILDGKMEIKHENEYEAVLNKYDIDRFSGDWDTTSVGKVRDFNLMIKGGEGDFFFYEIDDCTAMIFDDEASFKFIYCIDGKIEVNNKAGKAEEIFVTDEEEIFVTGNGKIFYGYII